MTIQVRRRRLSWYVVLVAANGETIMHSETYHSKSNAERAAANLREHLKP